jgi:hypothetical protein
MAVIFVLKMYVSFVPPCISVVNFLRMLEFLEFLELNSLIENRI